MKKRAQKRWILIPVISGLLAMAITGGAIFAQSNGHAGKFGSNGIFSRVAEILGVEETELQGAFTEARREGQDAALQNKLYRGVEDELFTQEDADQVMEWFQARPGAAIAMRMLLFRGNQESLQSHLDRMMERDRITQGEADQIMEWYQDRPEVLDTLKGPEGRRHHGGKTRGHHGRNGVEQFPQDSFQLPSLEGVGLNAM